MRILHVAPSIARSYGGPTSSLAGYVAASQRFGAEVMVVAPQAGRDDEAAMLTSTGPRGLKTFPSRGRAAFISSPALAHWVTRNAAEFDVVHVHGLFNPVSTFSARAAIQSGAAVVIRPFGTMSRYTFQHRRGTLKRIWFRMLERRNLTLAAALHFTTTLERDEAARRGVAFGLRAHVVPPAWVRGDGADAARAAPSERNTLLFLGRLDPVKNLESLLDAWSLLHDSLRPASLVIAGTGRSGYVRTLERRARERGIADHTLFAGFLSPAQKQVELARAKVAVLPSHHENFGVAALEAIAAGVPVVVSEAVQLRDFIEENRLGLACSGDARSVADAIRAVWHGDELRARVADSGPGLVEQAFGVERVGGLLRQMYLDALDCAGRSPMKKLA